ncbi:betaine-aldehyde dehydrogenase [Arthrobacter sp. 49Tsu3.1M3]|uniref:aminobutyraldehyde dehydrogenase n=1 Tax=Arthrobacter sp. 49Tsu3.1M3 TaxID=1279029 RepID=UPI0009C55BD8|nr:aminobutyraldehyde dehydrogenase [Arthrobacter sp. 49Tsu3.1M3]SKB44103.1 betaine-aldehyde dehydrogenase [Arthrobacter sp. 49Tsu3.1M3]
MTAEATLTDMQLQHFVNGQWLDGQRAESFPLIDPSNGKEVSRGPIASPAVVDRAVAAAREAFAEWRLTTPKERAQYLLKLADKVEEASDELALLESRNVGKPIANAQEELPLIVDLIRFYAGAVRVSEGTATAEYERGSTSLVLRQPIGVVGLITPWNYPLLEAVWKIGPALAAGNTVVLKPSEMTPVTTVMLARLAEDIFPAGVFNVVLGDGSTGAAIVNHPDIGLVSLTGDTGTGKKIATGAADSLKRVHLELGGKAPVLVFDDANLDHTADQLSLAAFANSGQDCTAACRIIVHEKVYDAFLEKFLNRVGNVVVGDPADSATQIGPVVSERQLDRVLGFLDRAKTTPARVRAGGQRLDRPGFFLPLTVITDVDQDSELVQKEVFGPVVTIQKATSDDEMLRFANGVPYGLSASVWTSSLKRTMRFMRDLNFGTVWINGHLTTVPEMPFGGFGESGYGKELSSHSIDEYSQVKHVMITSID